MESDRVAIGITGDEETTEGAIHRWTEDSSTSGNDQVVEFVRIIAGHPEGKAYTERNRLLEGDGAARVAPARSAGSSAPPRQEDFDSRPRSRTRPCRIEQMPRDRALATR